MGLPAKRAPVLGELHVLDAAAPHFFYMQEPRAGCVNRGDSCLRGAMAGACRGLHRKPLSRSAASISLRSPSVLVDRTTMGGLVMGLRA